MTDVRALLIEPGETIRAVRVATDADSIAAVVGDREPFWRFGAGWQLATVRPPAPADQGPPPPDPVSVAYAVAHGADVPLYLSGRAVLFASDPETGDMIDTPEEFSGWFTDYTGSTDE